MRRLEINISFSNYGYASTVILQGNLTTQSKTFAAPGDDDPDIEAENCY